MSKKYTFNDLDNTSGLSFTDISSESFRLYKFHNGSEVRINEPVALNVSKAGGHRILDSEGCSHYITPGWFHLVWKAKDGQPNFVK